MIELVLGLKAQRAGSDNPLTVLLVEHDMDAVFRLADPIGFDAPDEKPVCLMIFLLVPEASTQKHLEILSEIAEMLSDAVLRDKLKSCNDAQELHHLIASWQSVQTV